MYNKIQVARFNEGTMKSMNEYSKLSRRMLHKSNDCQMLELYFQRLLV